MSLFFDALSTVTGIVGGGAVAADHKKDTADRVMGGVGAGASALGAIGSFLAPGLSATATTGFGAMGAMEVAALPGLAAELGATAGTGAGIGAAAIPIAAVLGSAAAGWGAGRLLDETVGQFSENGRTLSDRVAGVQNTEGTRGGVKSFGEMSQAELTMAAMFNPGMNPERRREILAAQGLEAFRLFGGQYDG